VKVSSSTKVMALEEDRQFAFIAFTAAVAAMASIEQQHDIQLHQSLFDDCDSGALRTFCQGTQQSDDYSYYSQDPSVDDADPFLKRRDSFRPSLPRRDTISKRGTCFRIRAFHGRQTSSLSAATEDSYETNNGFDFGADIKIASLEEQLDDQQEEIMELHEEIKKQKYLNHRLANDLNAVKSKLFWLENSYALLTVDLASAQSALDDQAVAAQATLAKADLQLLEVSLDLQNCVQERTSITKKMDKMQKQITRLEKSIEDKDVRYRKAVEEHEIDKDTLHGLCHERDRLMHQLETVVKLDNEVTVEETVATYEKGRRWIRSGFINRFQVRNPRKKPEDSPLPGATVQ
jgi:predicted  nucleic acid-binding Zn-ribbon protein